ncbi:auxin response factor 10 [Cryptomeria japonica]|uniref:auxin response factor 10 n=1 Tax=Cryptomeria japonica TaxID=3369 RepID=UPI0025AB781E|nr:auxin response factor 10 [Cryptomeria japonica]
MPLPCTMNGPRITGMDSAYGLSVQHRGADDGSPGLDSQLWHACAGGMVQMPSVNARVYYFPQGQAEHSATNVDFPASLRANPAILCRVINVKYMADTETDEVYSRIRLVPIKPNEVFEDCNNEESENNTSATEKPVSFAKTLTQSDANNGGGFSVPRYCAETIFPRLDYSTDPPVQTVLAKDVHGEVWKFRHIYRGTPRRHLLTTGWSTFVNQKKLVAGDSIVFLRSLNGELCVGVRRSTRSTGGGDSSAWHLTGQQQQNGLYGSTGCASPYRSSSRWEVKGGDNFSAAFFGGGGDKGTGNGNSNGFARNRGKVSAKSVIESATLAASGQPFEVVYYPRASTPEFCVKAQAVDNSLRIQWSAGMRFKMAFETEDSSRISWFMGTISSVQFADPIHWPNSPWRLLQVTWDEPDLLQNVKRVSPWLVEVVSNMPPIQLSPFTLPKKKLRVSQHPEFQFEGQGIIGGLQMATLTNNMLGQINPWHGLSENVPAGMQGARHGHIYGIALSDLRPNKVQSGLFLDNLHHHEQGTISTLSNPVSTELNIGSFSQFDRSSVQDNLSCLLTVGNSSPSEQKTTNGKAGSSTTRSAPFLLFGKAIHPEQSSKSPQQQQSGVSSSDGPGHQTVNDIGSPGLTSNSSTDGNPEALDKSQRAMTVRSDVSKLSENSGLRLSHGDTFDSAVNNGLVSHAWFKDQTSMLTLEKCNGGKTAEDGIVHCKVFMESEDVGRTLDLSLFSTYDQLFNRLANMFGIEESDLANRVLYKDTTGTVRHTGDEPYREFMKTVRRLTILSDSGSDNVGS